MREYIFDLRAALGDRARSPIYVETVKGSGYRLIGGVVEESNARDRNRDLWRPRIAIVPPEPIDRLADHVALCRMFAGELTGQLTAFPELHVFARPPPVSANTAEWRPPSDSQPCADYLIRTEIFALEDDALMHVYLEDARLREVLSFWKIDVHCRSLVSQVSEAATDIANAIGSQHGTIHRAELAHLRRHDIENETAFGHYLQALELIDAGGNGGEAFQNQALAHIEQTIALDGEFPRYWLYDMMISDVLAQYQNTPEDKQRWLRRSHNAMEVAFSLAPRDPLVLSQMARIEARRGGLGDAVNALEQMHDIGRNKADIAMLFASYSACFGAGRSNICRSSVLNARRLNPLAPRDYINQEIRCAYLLGDFTTAAQLVDNLFGDGRPRPSTVSTLLGACSHLRLGNQRHAIEMFRKVNSHPFSKERDACSDYLPIRREPGLAQWHEDFDYLTCHA